MTEKLARRGLSVPRFYEPDHLRVTRVGAVMTRDVQVIQAGDTVDAVRQRFEAVGHSALPVMDEGRVVGIVSRRDLMGASNGALAARDVASRDVVTISPEANLLTALNAIVDEAVDHLPVVAHDDALVGIVTRTDIMRARADASRSDTHDGHRLRLRRNAA
jgi:CBS domain-containing protein